MPHDDVLKLSKELNVLPITARLLVNRGYVDSESAKNFLYPDLNSMPDPFLLKDMDRGTDIVIKAIQNKDKIAIYGDYDVDGLSSSALLTRFFREIDVHPEIYIPHRLDEGYGLHLNAIKELKARGIKLIITVDNGSTAIKNLNEAKKLGVDLVVTDHHFMEDVPSGDLCIINPLRPDCTFPEKYLAGSAVAFLFAVALRQKLNKKNLIQKTQPHLGRLINLASLGVIADVVPLIGTNRLLAKFGLKGLTSAHQIGLRELVKICGISGDMQEKEVSFRLAPRINAAGRMGEVKIALDLLLTEDLETATKLAESLSSLNTRRQKEEEILLNMAMDFAKSNIQEGATIVWGDNWHQGVMGIVASKLISEFKQPAGVISFNGDIGKGSLRGVDGGNIMPSLTAVSYLLESFGGHAGAAGVKIKRKNVEEFSKKFALLCRRQPAIKTKEKFETEAEEGELVDRFGIEASLLGPFGPQNPEPRILVKRKLSKTQIVKDKHLKIWFDEKGQTKEAIGFGMAKEISCLSDNIEFIATPRCSVFKGSKTLELLIKEIVKK